VLSSDITDCCEYWLRHGEVPVGNCHISLQHSALSLAHRADGKVNNRTGQWPIVVVSTCSPTPSADLITTWPWRPLTVRPECQCMPSAWRVLPAYTNFGVDSSRSVHFRARTHIGTHRQSHRCNAKIRSLFSTPVFVWIMFLSKTLVYCDYM